MAGDRGPFLPNPFVARAARWGLLIWSVIGLLILVALLFRYVLFPVRVVFAPLVVALIVIYLLDPLVSRLQARGIARVWGTLLVYVVVLSIVGVSLAYLTAVVAHQVREFVDTVPALLRKAQAGLATLSARLGVHLDTRGLVASFEPRGGTAFNFLGRLTSFTSGVVHVAFVIVLGPLIAFYLLVDLPKLRRGAEALIPASRREEMRGLARRVGATVGGFFRGQLLVAIMVGLVSMLGFYVVGLPYFALMGAITGLFALVPLIGTVIAAVPALFVAFTTSGRAGSVLAVRGGWPLAAACVVVLVLAQQLDTRVLSRYLLARTGRLHPVSVLLSLLVGGSLFGLWGMLLAVPVVAAVKVAILHVWDTRAQWPPRAEPASAKEAPSPAAPTLVEPPAPPAPAPLRPSRRRAAP